MTEELVSRYGPLCEIWYDAGLLHPRDGGPDVTPIVDRHQRRIVFYHSPQRREHRWIGNESGFAGDPCWATMPNLETAEMAHKNATAHRQLLLHGDPNGSLWSPGMVDVPVREHEWFWRPGEDGKVHSLETCLKHYYQSVGRNCTYIIGGTPDRDGLIPEADFRLYAELGKEIRRRFARPLATTRGTGTTIELRLPKPARFDHVVITEDIAHGERVREFTVEALRPGNRWEKVASGASIGHKRIVQVPAAEAARLRLLITKATGQPLIANFAAYHAV
jgi:alpha-L-fucosidase